MANTRRPAIFKRKLCGHVALAGIAAAILLALSFALDWPHSSVSTEKYRQYKLAKNADPRDQDAARESRVWLGRVLEAGRPEVANKKDEAAKPDSEEYTTALDLSAQWSTAIAAAEMVELTRLQILIGIFGILGLGATVYYAKRAANAAEKGATYAREQADTIRDEFNAAHRARVGLRFVDSVEAIAKRTRITGTLHISNKGDSAATVKNFTLEVKWRKKGAQKTESVSLETLVPVCPFDLASGQIKSLNFTTRPIFQSEGIITGHDTPESPLTAKYEFVLIGAINYTDASRIDRSTSFFRVYKPSMGTFVRYDTTDPHAERDYED